MSPRKVELHLYDLSNGLAAQLSLQLTGKYIPAIWHSSIVCFGVETYFGQGIQQCRPGQSHHGVAMKVVPLGETYIDKETFDDYIRSLREVYTAESYHLLEWNCNTFSNDVAGFLTGGQIPQDVIDLPKEFLSTPFGQALRPQIDAMFRRSAPHTNGISPPPGPNGVASALMNHVARTVQQPTPGYVNGSNHTEESLVSSLSIATNMASFNSILSSNRCVAVMFTGEHCGPCKTIKPTFESLAKRKKEEPPVSFVSVDTSAGREIASHYSITAVPTFKFFLEGKEQHEFKGADAAELRTQVGLLAMCYSSHSHSKLKLPTLRNLSLSPILYEQKPNFDAAIGKLETFKDTGKVAQTLEKAKPHLRSLSDAKKLSQEEIITIFQEVDVLLQELEAGQCFPLFDILKFAVLQTQVAELAAEALTQETNIIANVLSKGVSQQLTRSSQITLLRLLCNCFSNSILASRMLSEHRARDKVSSILIKALLEEDNTIRVAAGSLVYNATCWLRGQRTTWVDTRASDEASYSQNEEFEVELCTALLEALERENSLDVAHRLLASLGQLLLFSSHFDTALAPLLEALEAKRIVQSKKAVLETNVEAVKLIREISDLVEST